MSGHSKWSTIKRKKGAADAARGRVFTRLIREITIAARAGGSGDIESSPRLRTAVAAAKAANMPKDNIDRAIKKGTGDLEGASAYEEVIYEGYGPFGVAVLAETVTDNRNRTASDVRHVFTKHGGNLGAVGSVAWIFEPKGVIQVEKASITEDAVMEAAVEAGAEDVTTDDDERWQIVTGPSELHTVMKGLEEAGVPVAEAGLERFPTNTKTLGEEEASRFLKFFDMLEELDDVQKLFANFEIPDSVLEKLLEPGSQVVGITGVLPDSSWFHRIGLDVWLILRQSFVRFWEDDCPFFAAGIAFYSLFSIFSLLLLLSLILGLIFGSNPKNVDFLTTFMEGIAPDAASEFVRNQGERIMQGVVDAVRRPAPGILVPVAMGILLWTSSNVFQAFIHALGRIYHLGETRAAWRSRLLALGLAGGGALMMVVSFVLFVFGADLNEGLGQFQWIQGHIVQWILDFKRPIAIGGVFLNALLLYWLAPKFNQAHRTAWPGALVFTVLWLLVTEGFKVYLREVAVFDKIYGNATTLVIMILWVQITAQITLYGGEVNAAIHRLRRDRALLGSTGETAP